MRTTVVLKDELVAKARKLSREKTLNGLLNSCLADWIAQHSRKEIEARLADEYRQGRAESHRVSRDFAGIDKEGWPSWQGVFPNGHGCPALVPKGKSARTLGSTHPSR